MKYVIIGGAGHISGPLTEKLLAAGQEVTIVGRTAEKLQTFVDKGAKAALGTVDDVAFLTASFAGADAVFLMFPPIFSVDNLRHYQNTVARNYIAALTANHIKHVVFLSSIGAHMGNGAGPVDGLADMEDLLSRVENLNVKTLRPSYFMYNLFAMIPMIKGMNIMGGNFGGTDEKLALTHTDDIAAVAAEELLALNFTGQTVRYIAGDERKPEEIAAVLSASVDKPGVPWVVFSDEQTIDAIRKSGLADTYVDAYTSMGKALREGKMQEDYWKNRPALSPVKLEDFAKEFAAAFNAQD